MQIIQSNKIVLFLDECNKNFIDDGGNNFLNKIVYPHQKSYWLKKLKKAGIPEFQQEPVPDLYISAKEWMENPYNRAIPFSSMQDEYFSIEKEIIDPYVLFNSDAIQPDPNRTLKDWMKLRALDQPCETIVLYENEDDWMLSAPSESITNDPYAQKAHGHIVTFGLGIGYFTFMASINPNVQSITIVERSEQIIRLFKEKIQPHFTSNTPITIIHDDAYHRFNRSFLSQFDYCYVDIWQSSEDGLDRIEQLLEQYLPSYEDCDFWIEDSCYVVMHSLIYLHFKELVTHQTIQVSPAYAKRMRKIRHYFEQINQTIDDDELLKEYMYNKEIIREILAQKMPD